ncbi:hypothetical protein OG563_01155 [Nocardia vinacea]|uniref:Uncharacterized protein n=2 Tax=Nocardia vinacea TaxID=96468 RepID=A0ABZ1YUI0_9NOCA|nr:CorA family divalent cation transporter [Nocardia vinacea]
MVIRHLRSGPGLGWWRCNPALIATFYGMNFTWMPELEWEHGFLATTVMTLVAAVIPLVYIKRKGWRR